MAHWRALQVHPQREDAVERALHGHNMPVFCPKLRVRLHRPGSPIALRPLFPGYLFVNIDPGEGRGIAIVKRCHYVIGVLGSTPIPTTVMDAIQKAPANVCVSPQWVRGYSYRLKSPHALAGFLVRLERLDTHARARVILHLFGAERIVSVRVSDLQEQP